MAGSKYVWYDFMEDGEVDLEPGWDTAPLPPIEPSLDLERPVDLALSGVMGVPEFLRPGRAENNFYVLYIFFRKIVVNFKICILT